MTNNKAESYDLLKVWQIAKKHGFKSIQIFSDSDLLIKTLNSVNQFYNSDLNNTLQQVQNLFKYFERVQ